MKAQVIFGPRKDGHHDGSLKKQTYSFLQKLMDDPALPGLHIEPIQSSVDPRVRTGRVTQMYRAVLFKLVGDAALPHFVFVGVWPHDEAIEIARKAVLTANPVNGVTDLIFATQPDLRDAPDAAPPTPKIAPPAPTLEEPTPEVAPAPERVSAPVLKPWMQRANPSVTLEDLIGVLGISDTLAELAMDAPDEDAVLALADEGQNWEGLALLDLAAGRPLEEVQATLGLEQQDPDDARSEDERLIAGLKTPAAQVQFAWLDDDEELRRVVESDDFPRWRVFLHPEQRRYAERHYNGPFRLSGGAGTGKTVVLLHRARMLWRANPQARIVLTTFTRNLADALRRDLALLDPDLVLTDRLGEPGVFVTGVDAAAGKVVARAYRQDRDALQRATELVLGAGGNSASERTFESRQAWERAAGAAAALPPTLQSPSFLATEYTNVILPGRIATRDDYLRARRPGRGVALGRKQRAAIWDIVSAYRASAAAEGALDFGEVCAVAAELCASGSGALADHVLIDEGQDLSPPQWQFLRALAAPGADDLFIAEDSQQRIYGQPVVLGRLGIRVTGRSRRLTLNYRTTEQVLRFATGILDGSDYVDLDDEGVSTSGFRSARGGPIPNQKATGSISEQLDEAGTLIEGWISAGVAPETIGVLTRDQRAVDQVAVGLQERKVDVRRVERSAAVGGLPQLMTMHRAKGMEFSRVVIFGASEDLLPAQYLLRDVPEEERADLIQRERSLFYVAATRARDELAVLWTGAASPFLRHVDGPKQSK